MTADQRESERMSFVIKIWLEGVSVGSTRAKWRGHITHVGTGERRYVERLQDIASFLEGHLIAIGAELNPSDEHGQA